ncbi:zinc-binding dehydrogenase [Haladaptatus pallidirubidus]|uniref:zinc-binding dehydrogenase n=1 Tax=Haladaptatus pallidirubidus TaxID=1008152 RepID=UPI0036F2F02F
MLHRIAKVRPGQTVLVHGASGGVGTVLTQLARLRDVRVLGTASAAKHDTVRAMGATPIDYRTEDVPARVAKLAPDGVDAVFDHLGGPAVIDSWQMLDPAGRSSRTE